MTDEEVRNEEKQQESAGPSSSAEAWREVGLHFQALGESLANAFRSAWDSPESRQNLEDVQASLEKMVEGISRTIREAPDSPELRRVQEEAEKAAQTARAASRQAADEAKPHVLSALRQLREEINKMISRMEAQDRPASSPPSEDSTPPTPPV